MDAAEILTFLDYSHDFSKPMTPPSATILQMLRDIRAQKSSISSLECMLYDRALGLLRETVSRLEKTKRFVKSKEGAALNIWLRDNLDKHFPLEAFPIRSEKAKENPAA
jgi:hypothetical protein